MPQKQNCIISCLKMDIEDGQIENEYDFAEDAIDFDTQLAEAKDVTFTQTLQEPLCIGSHIICTGTPSEDLPWFALNIGSGDVESGKADIAVHFNVRLPQCYVVRNTRRNGKWGAEETTAFRMFPFKMERPFTIEVLIDENTTMFAVDGSHYCGFAHRSPSPLTASWVQVTGIRDAAIDVAKADVYPKLAPPVDEVPITTSIDNIPEGGPEWRPNVIASLAGGVPEGYQLVIHGKLRPLLHSFSIDLTDGTSDWPHANIHFHINVRAHVEAQLPRQLVVLNAWFGAWGAERRQRTARLIPGTETTFRIVRGAAEWSVFADGLLLGELEYRGDASGVRGFRLRGDLFPSRVYLCPVSSSPIRDDC